MSVNGKTKCFNLGRMYAMAQRLYSALPYKYLKNGYAFPPWHYYMEVTRRCNLRCQMCQYIEWLENVPVREQKEGELSTEEWHKVIDQVRRLSLVTFTGGEPFVRSDFMELLEHASRRARTHFISNTTALTEERAEAVANLAPKRLGGLGFNVAGTSIEAPGELHDEIRRMKGAYERSMEGLRLLQEFRERSGKQCPMIHVTTVIQDANAEALEHMPRAMKEAGVDSWNLVTETRMFELPELGLRDPSVYNSSEIPWPRIGRQKLTDALNRTIAAAKDAGIELRLPRMPKEELINYYDEGLDLSHYECRNAWNTLLIGRQGDVHPCWIMRVGNVRENSIKELWHNAEMRTFRQTCQQKLFAMCPGCCFLEHKDSRPAASKS